MRDAYKAAAIVGTAGIIALGIANYNQVPPDSVSQFAGRIEADRDDGIYDYDCGDFSTREEAQAFFIDAGGPQRDPYGLDGDEDGEICENHSY